MKPILKFTAYFLIAGSTFFSCKKEATPPKIYQAPVAPPKINQAPVANAGADVTLLLSCSQKVGLAELDGSSSSDPDSNIVRYNWAPLYGPQGYILSDSNSAKATVENLSPGIYAFELTVTDVGGLFSKDTVMVSVQGGIPTEYDLDISLDTTFYNYVYPRGYGPDYYDFTVIWGPGIVQPFGEFEVHVFQSADTAALSDTHNDQLQIISNATNSPAIYIEGSLSGINFKKLFRQGGGSFSGTCTVTEGSAADCNANVFTNLPPLVVTGSLDVTTEKVTMRVKGKVYF